MTTAALGKLNRITIRIKCRHEALPRFIVRRFMKYYTAGLQIFVKRVKIIGAELYMDRALLQRAGFLGPV